MILKEFASEIIFAFLKVHACLTFKFVTSFLLCFYYFWAENISEYCRKDKSLGVLSQKFLMMFLVSEVKSSSHVIIHHMIFHMLYYYTINLCNLIGLEQWYFSLI